MNYDPELNRMIDGQENAIQLTVHEPDATGKSILEVDGAKFFWQGKTEKGDWVWQAESKPEQIVFVAPDFEITEFRSGFDMLVALSGTEAGRNQ